MPIDLKERQKAQHQFIIALIETAKARVEALPKEKLLLDPQGRILIDVPADAGLTGVQLQEKSKALGLQITPVTTVSLDIRGIGEPLETTLRAQYKEQFGIDYTTIKDLSAKGSIIALQEEFHFHLALAARTYTKAKPGLFPESKMEIAHQEAMVRVQPLIQDAFKKAIKNATGWWSGSIDDAKLIKELDKARKSISKKAHQILAEEIVKATGVRLSETDISQKDLQHLAETTTATANAVLHTDGALEQSTWIAGNEVTAHDRGKGKLADRQIVTFADKADQQGMPRIQIRVPSLDVKKGLKASDAIADVKAKLERINKKYDLAEALPTGTHPTGIQSFTYNLHTAIYTTSLAKMVDGSNKQTQGAEYILRGAHEYNLSQLDKEKPIYCFVQNISVNGYSDLRSGVGAPLGYEGSALKREATLMAEMAMIQNLVAADDKVLASVKSVFENYKEYLKSDRRPAYFSQSTQGAEALASIELIKKEWAEKAPASRRDTFSGSSAEAAVGRVKAALKVMMAHNLHRSHDFAKLFQAMSVYVEQASISGCKSGNERAQAINGRVAILDSLAGKTVNDDHILIAIDLITRSTEDTVKEHCDILKATLDERYDKHLQGAVSMISSVDQGGPAKVQTKNKYLATFDTNKAEESTLSHLHQENASSMQAHKKLTKYMAGALKEPKGFVDILKAEWGFLKSKVGGLLATIAMPVAVIVAAVAATINFRENRSLAKAQKKLDVAVQVYEAQKKAADAEPLEKVLLESHAKITDKISKIVDDPSAKIPSKYDLAESSAVNIRKTDGAKGTIGKAAPGKETPEPALELDTKRRIQPVSEKNPHSRVVRNIHWVQDKNGLWKRDEPAPDPSIKSVKATLSEASISKHMDKFKHALEDIKRTGEPDPADGEIPSTHP